MCKNVGRRNFMQHKVSFQGGVLRRKSVYNLLRGSKGKGGNCMRSSYNGGALNPIVNQRD